MKKVRICFEIKNLAVDENGNPAPAGLAFSFGEVPDETFAKLSYEEMVKKVDLEKILAICWPDGTVSPEDCRIITPEEYDAEYGEGSNENE